MVYQPERWVNLVKQHDVFEIQIPNLENINRLLSASNSSVAYNRGGTILIEWTLSNRETIAGLVGQYIVRHPNGSFNILDYDELIESYEPHVEKVEDENEFVHPTLGSLLAVIKDKEEAKELIFAKPDGSPTTFVLCEQEVIEETTLTKEEETPKPTPAMMPKKSLINSSEETKKEDND